MPDPQRDADDEAEQAEEVGAEFLIEPHADHGRHNHHPPSLVRAESELRAIDELMAELTADFIADAKR